MGTKLNFAAILITKYILWAALSAMGFFILLTGRTSLLTVIARYADSGFYQAKQVRVIDQIYLVIGGILALACMVVLQHYLTNSSGWRNALVRFALIFGIQLIALGLFTFVRQMYLGDIFTSPSTVVALLGPLLAGASLVTIGATKKTNQ